MRLIVKATNIALTPAIRAYVEQKIGTLARFLQNIEPHDDENLEGRDPVEVRVEVGKPSLRHRRGKVYYAEVNIDLPGRVLRAESYQWDLRKAIDEIKDEMQGELKQYKAKQRARARSGARLAKNLLRAQHP